jgi:hypothetical protein
MANPSPLGVDRAWRCAEPGGPSVVRASRVVVMDSDARGRGVRPPPEMGRSVRVGRAPSQPSRQTARGPCAAPGTSATFGAQMRILPGHACATFPGHPKGAVATVGALLGHRRGSPVTLRYVHTDDERLRAAAATVGTALG